MESFPSVKLLPSNAGEDQSTIYNARRIRSVGFFNIYRYINSGLAAHSGVRRSAKIHTLALIHRPCMSRRNVHSVAQASVSILSFRRTHPRWTEPPESVRTLNVRVSRQNKILSTVPPSYDQRNHLQFEAVVHGCGPLVPVAWSMTNVKVPGAKGPSLSLYRILHQYDLPVNLPPAQPLLFSVQRSNE